MKFKITKTIRWYEFDHDGVTYDARVISVKNCNNQPVKDVTIFHGSKPVNDVNLHRLFETYKTLHEGM